MQLVKHNWRPWLWKEAKAIAFFASFAALVYGVYRFTGWLLTLGVQ